MKQLITRIDPDLHARVKRLAAEEGRSVNALVTDLLQHATDGEDRRAALRRRLEREGRLVVLMRPEHVPTDEELERATAGVRVSDLLEAERAQR